MRFPDFICIGAMRCGTTTLWNLMVDMPDVYMPDTKELHFFDKDYDLGLEYYSRHFQGAAPNQICGEFTPDYLPISCCPQRLKENNLAPKLVVILRDPVLRAWSHYRFSVRWGPEKLAFWDAIEKEESRLATGGYREAVFYSYFERGRYASQLKHWENYYSKDQILVVFLEELRRDTVSVLSNVRAHIGLPEAMTREPSLVHENEAGQFPNNLTLHHYMQVVLDKAKGDTIPAKGLRRVARTVHDWNLSDQLPKLSNEHASILRERYASENKELEEWLGRTLPWS